MYLDVRVIYKETECTIIERKVFPKKRKRNKKVGLEREFVATERQYVLRDKLRISARGNGRVVVHRKNGGRTLYLRKGDVITISRNGVTVYGRNCEIIV